ncbi:hypothetical protein ES703_47773 [subsurface metagenome]
MKHHGCCVRCPQNSDHNFYAFPFVVSYIKTPYGGLVVHVLGKLQFIHFFIRLEQLLLALCAVGGTPMLYPSIARRRRARRLAHPVVDQIPVNQAIQRNKTRRRDMLAEVDARPTAVSRAAEIPIWTMAAATSRLTIFTPTAWLAAFHISLLVDSLALSEPGDYHRRAAFRFNLDRHNITPFLIRFKTHTPCRVYASSTFLPTLSPKNKPDRHDAEGVDFLRLRLMRKFVK